MGGGLAAAGSQWDALPLERRERSEDGVGGGRRGQDGGVMEVRGSPWGSKA